MKFIRIIDGTMMVDFNVDSGDMVFNMMPIYLISMDTHSNYNLTQRLKIRCILFKLGVFGG